MSRIAWVLSTERHAQRRRMKQSYHDITDKMGAPIWWDEAGCPRYGPFHPNSCNSIYTREAVLLEISCQVCPCRFKVAVAYHFFGPNLITQLKDHQLHYGDPPRHKCPGAGETMNSDALQVLEFWQRQQQGGGGDWTRVPELEGRIV